MLFSKLISFSALSSILFLNSASLEASNDQEVQSNFVGIVKNESDIKVERVVSRDEYEKIVSLLGEDSRFDENDISSEQKDREGNFEFLLNEDPLKNGPHGLYKITKAEKIVGCQAMTISDKGDFFIIEEITNILEKFQGQGYGKILRTGVVKLLSKYINEQISISYNKEVPKWEQKTLVALTCDNEWLWGVNGASLKTTLDAGYGIACIGCQCANLGLVQMIYPRDERMWSDERQVLLLKISRLNAKSPQAESIPLYFELLGDLDLRQDTEISTFFAIVWYLTNRFNDQNEKDQIRQDLNKFLATKMSMIMNRRKGDVLAEQSIDSRLIAFSDLDFYSFDECLKSLGLYQEPGKIDN